MTTSKKPGLLLHVCCAPCSTTAIERLREDYELTAFFFNPNIYPESERNKRAEEFTALTSALQIPALLCNQVTETAQWYDMVQGHESDPECGPRCLLCYRMRLQRTAETARAQGIAFFATTLTLSPQKKAEVINALGEEIGTKFNVSYVPSNFKKQDGFRRSVELSIAHGLYRQDYCGCQYSRRPEREKEPHV